MAAVTMGRALAALFLAGSTLALVAIVLFPLPVGTDVPASLAVLSAGYVAAAVLLRAGGRLPSWGLELFLAFGTLCVTLGIYFSGDVATDNQMFYLWVGLYAGYFLSRSKTALQLAFAGACYAGALALGGADSAPVVHWLITMGTLVVSAELVAGLSRRVAKEALYDPLTGLPHRALLLDRLERALVRRGERPRAAVLLVALDRFRLVTNSLGHESGDRLLREVGRRLQACLRPEDTVARFGEDRFAILLEGINEAGQAAHAAERMADRLREPFAVAGRELFLASNIGLALDGPGIEGPRDLVRAADVAVSRARDAGRGGFEVFEASMQHGAARRLELQSDLRRAVENAEFEVHYQPKVTLETGAVLGTEALVRWNHPQRA